MHCSSDNEMLTYAKYAALSFPRLAQNFLNHLRFCGACTRKIVLVVNRALRLGLTHFAKAPFSPLQRYDIYLEL